jgi:hypothetical protein
MIESIKESVACSQLPVGGLLRVLLKGWYLGEELVLNPQTQADSLIDPE